MKQSSTIISANARLNPLSVESQHGILQISQGRFGADNRNLNWFEMPLSICFFFSPLITNIYLFFFRQIKDEGQKKISTTVSESATAMVANDSPAKPLHQFSRESVDMKRTHKDRMMNSQILRFVTKFKSDFLSHKCNTQYILDGEVLLL